MKIDQTARYILKTQMEEALQRYEDYKAGNGVPHTLQAILDMLEEIDAVGAYVYSRNSYGSQNERKALKMYLAGNRMPEIAKDMGKCGVSWEEVRQWFDGTNQKEGFLEAMFDKLMKMNRYCPFCNTAGVEAKASSYPLNGTVCPHREIEWSEEG